MFFVKSTLFFSDAPGLCSILEKKVCRNPRRSALSGWILVKIEQKTAQNRNFRIVSDFKNGSFCTQQLKCFRLSPLSAFQRICSDLSKKTGFFGGRGSSKNIFWSTLKKQKFLMHTYQTHCYQRVHSGGNNFSFVNSVALFVIVPIENSCDSMKM